MATPPRCWRRYAVRYNSITQTRKKIHILGSSFCLARCEYVALGVVLYEYGASGVVLYSLREGKTQVGVAQAIQCGKEGDVSTILRIPAAAADLAVAGGACTCSQFSLATRVILRLKNRLQAGPPPFTKVEERAGHERAEEEAEMLRLLHPDTHAL